MTRPHFSRGFTLIELMISLVLGLVVVGGVISVLIANKSSYRANEGMSQIQESVRSAFELMARDIRQTGGTGCDNARRMTTAFSTGTTQWWKTWATIQGFEESQTDTAVAIGTAVGTRVAGTDSLHLHSIEGTGFPVDVHDPVGRTIKINDATSTSFGASENILICDFDHAAMFRAGAYTGGTTTLAYSTTGNCTTGLGFPVNCDGSTGNVYTFPRNSWMGRLSAMAWFVGNNGRTADGGRSLYRMRLGTGTTVNTEEVVAGVTDMEIQYSRNDVDTVVDASSIVGAAEWAKVTAVFITLTIRSSDSNISTSSALNSGRLERPFTYVVALRNRVP
jgi:type IV pilus assembly protein PilW